MFVHLVARTFPGLKVFETPEQAWKVWDVVRGSAPDVVSACLMPNHLHQIEDTDDPRAAKRRLASRLGACAKQLGGAALWQRLPEPEIIVDVKHLMRQVRYVHLNPCRAYLVDDPLCWPWSTHRGSLGMTLDPWVTPARLAKCLGRRVHAFPAWFHGYVSGDPHVRVEGTPLPVPAPTRPLSLVPLHDVIAAAHAVAPRSATVRRRLAVLLAHDQGWGHSALLADALDVTPRAVRRLASRPDAELLRLGRLYLADKRLRHVPGNAAHG